MRGKPTTNNLLWVRDRAREIGHGMWRYHMFYMSHYVYTTQVYMYCYCIHICTKFALWMVPSRVYLSSASCQCICGVGCANEPLCAYKHCERDVRALLGVPFRMRLSMRRERKEKSVGASLRIKTCVLSIALYGVVSVTSNQFIQRHSTDWVCTVLAYYAMHRMINKIEENLFYIHNRSTISIQSHFWYLAYFSDGVSRTKRKVENAVFNLSFVKCVLSPLKLFEIESKCCNKLKICCCCCCWFCFSFIFQLHHSRIFFLGIFRKCEIAFISIKQILSWIYNFDDVRDLNVNFLLHTSENADRSLWTFFMDFSFLLFFF